VASPGILYLFFLSNSYDKEMSHAHLQNKMESILVTQKFQYFFDLIVLNLGFGAILKAPLVSQ